MQAGLLSAAVGFDAVFFGRADYQAWPCPNCLLNCHLCSVQTPPVGLGSQDMAHRKNLTAMEMVWQGSASLEDATVFTGNFISGEPRQAVVPWQLSLPPRALLLAGNA